jgi:6-pyruvoyltetrahydropterin/6-carboxytetrahydropterin synthase
MFELVFNRKWEAAHRFIEGENKQVPCSQPHGHTWEVNVALSPITLVILNKTTNTIVLFEKVKKRWHAFIDTSFDHGFFFNHRDPMLEFILKENPQGRHIAIPGDPTTEIISVLMKSKLESFLKADALPLKCTRVQVIETRTNSVTFTGAPSEVLQMPNGNYWWNRADNTTHDLESLPNGYPC